MIMRRMIFTKIFSIIKKMKKLYCIICGKYRKFEKPFRFFLLVAVSARVKMKKKKKIEEESTEILKILGLINNIEKHQNI